MIKCYCDRKTFLLEFYQPYFKIIKDQYNVKFSHYLRIYMGNKPFKDDFQYTYFCQNFFFRILLIFNLKIENNRKNLFLFKLSKICIVVNSLVEHEYFNSFFKITFKRSFLQIFKVTSSIYRLTLLPSGFYCPHFLWFLALSNYLSSLASSFFYFSTRSFSLKSKKAHSLVCLS